MLAANVRFEGFTVQQWTLLAEVFRPRRGRLAPDTEELSGGGVVVVRDARQVLKLLDTRRGRLDPSGLGASGLDLGALVQREEARWGLCFDTGALDSLMERWGDRVSRGQDAADQLVELVRVLRDLEAEGRVHAWPWRIASWPIPSPGMRQRALDSLCPAGRSLLLGAFEDGELATAICLRRGASGFDFILGPDQLRGEMGLVSGDWTRDYRHLLRAAESRLGPLAIGCYGELGTFQRLAERPGPGAWATAVAARDVILSPVVPALAIPLGVDVGRAAFEAIRGLAERLGAGAWFGHDSPLAPAVERVVHAVEDRDVIGLLGFDPIELLRKLLVRRRDP